MATPFEKLEDRRLMAGDFAVITPILTLYHPLTIDGTPYNDSIYVSNDGAGNIVVNNNGAVSTYTDPWISSVIVNANSGNDYVWTAANIGHRMEIHGGYGADTIYGGDLNDQIDGGGDSDYIYGRAGNDSIDGGVPGFAYYWDNTGNDQLYGADGSDTINASDVGNCTLDGGNGDDVLYGWQGNDVIRGGWGNDVAYGYTGDDTITGYTGNDSLYGQDGNDTIRGEWDNDVVSGGNGNDNLHGDSGDDWVYGDAGDDKLYGDAGCDGLVGGDGNDILVNVGGGQNDCAWGQGGFDSFWCDSEGTENVWDADWSETVNGNVHRVGSFMTERFTNNSIWPWDWSYQTPSRDAVGQNFRDPDGGASPANFSSRPLFNTGGPSKDDIDQNALGDCYYLATLSAVAKADANRIRQSVVELGDGTYAVRFYSGGSEVYLRVDGDLPTNGYGSPTFAGLGTGNSTWVAVMVKAWAHFRRNEGTYSSIESGWMDEAFSAVGASTMTLDVDFWYKAFNNADGLWNYVCARLSEGRAVTVGTHGSPTALVGSHAYMVDSVYYSGSTKMVRLRNPWGSAGNPGAYVNISAQQLFDSISRVQSAYV
jgi:Ca2+-binding RTX toxin-like protein